MTSTSSDTQSIPLLEVTKTAVVADINNNAKTDLGDVITRIIFRLKIKEMYFIRPYREWYSTDGLGNALNLNSGLTYINATAGSSSTTLQVSGNY